ncbi:MAG: SpoIIE family protein phosphatase [candidate division KSB1 bacterium]|nr:SpoIIE family protein phosphatase [candidate division KSB1 bacterium]
MFGTNASETSQNAVIAKLQNEVQRLRSAVEELTVLNDLAIAAGTSLEVDQMLDIIVAKSIKAVKAEQGSIMLLTEEKETPLRTLIRQADQRSRLMTYKIGINITGWVLRHQQPLVIEDLATDSRFQTTEQERQEIKSVVCIPIRSKAQLIGILTVANKKTPEPFSAEDLRLLSIIAAQSAQLIRNSQLQQEALEKKRLEQELAMAREIQLGLLPKRFPKTAGLEISSYFNSADEVSGDYYDYFYLGPDKIGMVLADVSGHGASAALLMTMVKGILHAITQNFVSPDRVLAEMNAILDKIIPKDKFVTMLFLVFDLQNKTLRYSNAGHNPLLFFDQQSQQVQMVQLRGPALGLTKLAVFQPKEIPLNPGDLLLIYTDGVTESFNAQGEMFEEERLMQAVQETVSEPAGKIIAHLNNKLRAFTGNLPQADDVAMIAVKVI